MLTREAIAGLIPHQGAMCLLGSVEQWDATSIHCRTTAHLDPANPLRRDGRLAAACTVEFALQAMALHGALTAGGPQAPGFVTSLREVELARLFADDLGGPLDIRAGFLAAERRGCVYSFSVTAGAEPVASGQATIIIPDAPA